MTLHVSVDTGCNLSCNYSMVEGTRILTADLEWVPIEELDLGDEVVSFENPEYHPEKSSKDLVVGEVTACYKYKEDAVRVTTEDAEVTVGESHPLLSKYHGWRDACDFKEGQYIRSLTEPCDYEDTPDYQMGYVHGAFAGDGTVGSCVDGKGYEQNYAEIRCQDEEIVEAVEKFAPESYGLEVKEMSADELVGIGTRKADRVDAISHSLPQSISGASDKKEYMRGWLSGLFDTDGAFDGQVVRFCQNEGDVKAAAYRFIEELGYDAVSESEGVRVSDGRGGRFRFLTEIRPKVSRKVRNYEGLSWTGSSEVVDVEEVGEKILYDVTVDSEHTLVTEGLMSHNCYEEPDRAINGNNVQSNYDMDAILERLEEFKEEHPREVPGLHGGEPLLLRNEDIETLFKWVYDNYEQVRSGEEYTHIQTNATLIKDEHIDIFKKYNVNVGISCDGPPELNAERKAALNEDATEDYSEITNENIFKLAEEGVSVGVIVVLHETNAGTDEKLEKLLDWMDDLNQLGVSGHYNEAIPYDEIQTDLSLSAERMKEVFIQTWEWMKEEDYRSWNPMRQFQDNLLGNGIADCRVANCDVFNAGAAKVVDGEGETSGCGKTWAAVGDGTPFLQGPSNDSEYNADTERWDMLKQLPGAPETEGPDLGGCKGCRYAAICKGGCPSAGIDDDYRNRTMWCESKYYLYKRIEEDMRQMFPNIRLITDLPWDAEIQAYANNNQLDIAPFAAMNPSREGKSSVYGGFDRQVERPIDRVPDEILPNNTHEEQIRRLEERHGEENITYEKDGDALITHADSDMGEETDG